MAIEQPKIPSFQKEKRIKSRQKELLSGIEHFIWRIMPKDENNSHYFLLDFTSDFASSANTYRRPQLDHFVVKFKKKLGGQNIRWYKASENIFANTTDFVTKASYTPIFLNRKIKQMDLRPFVSRQNPILIVRADLGNPSTFLMRFQNKRLLDIQLKFVYKEDEAQDIFYENIVWPERINFTVRTPTKGDFQIPQNILLCSSVLKDFCFLQPYCIETGIVDMTTIPQMDQIGFLSIFNLTPLGVLQTLKSMKPGEFVELINFLDFVNLIGQFDNFLITILSNKNLPLDIALETFNQVPQSLIKYRELIKETIIKRMVI
jgi:hypothetical protein